MKRERIILHTPAYDIELSPDSGPIFLFSDACCLRSLPGGLYLPGETW